MAKKKPLEDFKGAKNFIARLQDLAVAWQKLAKPALKHRYDLLKLRASGYYDENYTKWHVLNLVDRGISTIVPFLIEGNPRISVDTRVINYRPYALTAELGLNHLIERMNLADTVLIPAAFNSMVGSAITRTDFYYDRIISLDGEIIKVGTPHVELIDDSNYIGDATAKRRNDFTFEGDIYTLPTEYAKDFFAGKDEFGNEIADYITSDSKLYQDFSPEELTGADLDKVRRLLSEERTTFIDLYLRDENSIITFMPKGKKAKLLRSREWEGPGEGPYDYLGYNFMPESPFPIPPAWFWHDMDVSVNILVDKMKELAENQKDVIAFSDEAAEDIKKVLNTPNAGSVRVADVNAMKTISINGIKDRSNWDWVQFMLLEQTKQGANPDILGGRGSQSPTLGQEQMIYNNATRVINNMYSRYQGFVTSIIKKLAWAFWTDPTLEVPVVKNIPGFGPLPEVFSSADRVGDFYDFVFDITPYSTQRSSPELQYQKVMQLMVQWVMPTLEYAAQQGATLDIPTLTKDLANKLDIVNFNQYYRTAVPDPGSTVPYQMMPSTDRKEPRTRPGATGMTNDSFGTTLGNQMANQNQEQSGTGANQNV